MRKNRECPELFCEKRFDDIEESLGSLHVKLDNHLQHDTAEIRERVAENSAKIDTVLDQLTLRKVAIAGLIISLMGIVLDFVLRVVGF